MGYGNISPRTERGKIMTILYAIFGIPLMLLYLTNIGDILAKAFRYVYGRCCVCKSESRDRKQLYNRSVRYGLNRSVSAVTPGIHQRMLAQPTNSLPNSPLSSLNRPMHPILHQMSSAPPPGIGDQQTLQTLTRDNTSLFQRQSNRGDLSETGDSAHTPPPHNNSLWEGWNFLDGAYFCFVTLSTIGFGDLVPGASVVGSDSSQEKLFTESAFNFNVINERTKESSRVHVPITLCLVLLTSYVCGGGVLFSLWEGWNFLDGAYFCFVTLSTIGFGDLVPGASVVGSDSSQEKLVICSLYLLAGMALLAMCFNLMQEEVIHKVRSCGRRLGIISENRMALLAMCFNLMQEEVIHKVRSCGRRLGIISENRDEEEYGDEFDMS
ncbi:unnamed protein product [Medioppia subpectinata]|uniref:Potassium channel domain-containing protein n=1 Tax=Medioppia subpectinata TaxID=1979941 RepID=A0A7R9PXA4_9ACAR|nr:unnamed protein product [Medioppia subpectinata]CAG2104187.1 unnamed protein product [Medioppia subpectinata]